MTCRSPSRAGTHWGRQRPCTFLSCCVGMSRKDFGTCTGQGGSPGCLSRAEGVKDGEPEAHCGHVLRDCLPRSSKTEAVSRVFVPVFPHLAQGRSSKQAMDGSSGERKREWLSLWLDNSSLSVCRGEGSPWRWRKMSRLGGPSFAAEGRPWSSGRGSLVDGMIALALVA